MSDKAIKEAVMELASSVTPLNTIVAEAIVIKAMGSVGGWDFPKEFQDDFKAVAFGDWGTFSADNVTNISGFRLVTVRNGQCNAVKGILPNVWAFVTDIAKELWPQINGSEAKFPLNRFVEAGKDLNNCNITIMELGNITRDAWGK